MSYRVSRCDWQPDLPGHGNHCFYAVPVGWRGGSTQLYARLTDEDFVSDFWTIRTVQ